jgi:hypothetical protein
MRSLGYNTAAFSKAAVTFHLLTLIYEINNWDYIAFNCATCGTLFAY